MMIWFLAAIAYALMVIYIISTAMALAMAFLLHVAFLFGMVLIGWLLWELRKGDERPDPPETFDRF